MKIGDIAVYSKGTVYEMNRVVLIEGMSYGGSELVSVCNLMSWNVPLGWAFGVKAEELTVIHHVDPPSQEKRRGVNFAPSWLSEIRPDIKTALQAFKDAGCVLPSKA